MGKRVLVDKVLCIPYERMERVALDLLKGCSWG